MHGYAGAARNQIVEYNKEKAKFKTLGFCGVGWLGKKVIFRGPEKFMRNWKNGLKFARKSFFLAIFFLSSKMLKNEPENIIFQKYFQPSQ